MPPGMGLPLPGGGALLVFTYWQPWVPTWPPLLGQQVFLQGFYGVPMSGARTAQSTFVSNACILFPAVRWHWWVVGGAESLTRRIEPLAAASVSSGHEGNETFPCRVS